jgi:selenocysteine lyase/cysteine desulfurase
MPKNGGARMNAVLTTIGSMTPTWSAADFDLPPDTVYLNAAGMGPRLRCVSEAARQAITESAAPWTLSAGQWEHHRDDLRRRMANLIETEPDALAYCPSVSYGMAVAARNLPLSSGQSVVALAREHPSNRSVWQHAAAARGALWLEADRQVGESWTDAVLRQLDTRTAVVCIPQVHWTDGAVLDLARIRQRTATLGAALVIDASQSLGAMPFDWNAIAPDFVIAPGHKWLLGAYGLGWLWAAPHWRQHGEPLEHSLTARDATGDYSQLREPPPYLAGARRFDFGASAHPLLMPMALAATTQLQMWGMPQVQAQLATLSARITAAFNAKGLGDGLRDGAPHITAWTPPAGALDNVEQRLREADIIVAIRDGRLRITPHLHVDAAQIDHFAATLATAV